MVPKLAGRGSSFKGAGQYYLHDKQAETSERVAWTETVNLRAANPDRAIRVMAATAMDRDALKLAAGIRAGGRSSDKVVQTYSLAWHPEQQPSKAEMVEAARESLDVLGLSEHQALIVCHTDEPHPHVHVIVNRVSPGDGRLASTSREKLKLSRWAEAWEKRHGKVYCDERVTNNVERDRRRAVNTEKEESRQAVEVMREATEGLNKLQETKAAATELKADQQRKASELAALGRAMHEHYREELANLGADYLRDKTKIKAEQHVELSVLKAENRKAIGDTMRAFAEQQNVEQQTIAWRERSMLGRVWNAVDAGRMAKGWEQRLGKTLWATISKTARTEGLRSDQRERRQAVYQEVVSWAGQREAELRVSFKARYDANYQKFTAARASTLDRYKAEQKDYRCMWAKRSEARREAWREFRRLYEPKERIRQLHDRQRENLQQLKEKEARTASSSASRSHGRSRGRGYDVER